MAVTKKVNRDALTADYDRAADVLYMAIGSPRPSEGEEMAKGIVVRYPFDEPDKARAVTVVGFRANGWSRNVEALAKRIADILSVNRLEVVAIIRRATRT